MKIIYVVGLEHSGSTLTDHLLSSHPRILGLGEIASFFSPPHMKRYMNKWGGYPETSSCSCENDWEQCDFWGKIFDLCGLNSKTPMISKYKRLFTYVRERLGEDAIIVDSSKSLDTLEMLVEGSNDLDILPTDIYVIFTIKDVRSFLVSMVNKHDTKKSLVSVYRGFNYWLGANKQILNYIDANNINASINLYEELCTDPSRFIDMQTARVGCIDQADEIDIRKNTSHIAMGNKNFILRNRNKIQYDSLWYNDDVINLVYLIHGKARAFNKYIYSLNRSENA